MGQAHLPERIPTTTTGGGSLTTLTTTARGGGGGSDHSQIWDKNSAMKSREERFKGKVMGRKLCNFPNINIYKNVCAKSQIKRDLQRMINPLVVSCDGRWDRWKAGGSVSLGTSPHHTLRKQISGWDKRSVSWYLTPTFSPTHSYIGSHHVTIARNITGSPASHPGPGTAW